MRATTLGIAALVVAVALPVTYVGLGGGRYRPPGITNPCDAHHWGEPRDYEQLAERLAGAALDEAACDLGVSRQTLVLVVARGGSDDLAEELNLSDAEMERAIRSGADRAIRDALNKGVIGFVEASFLRVRARDLSVETLIALLIDPDQRRRLAEQLEAGGL
jgi:hypothetical protein